MDKIEALNIVYKRCIEVFRKPTPSGRVRPVENLDKDFIGKVWSEYMLRLMNLREEGKADPLSAEKLVLALKKRGLPEKNISYRRNSFTVMMKNVSFRIYKRDNGFRIGIPGEKCEILPFCGADHARIAAALEEFDSMMPEILKKKAEISEKVRIQEMEDEKIRQIRDTIRTTVDSLIEQFLLPRELQVTFRISDDNSSVDFTVVETKKAEFSVPIEKLRRVQLKYLSSDRFEGK
ncbi:MAG: hypothetical protein IJ161_13710 [Bacteroidales bacterium]|nr:hypothetical protein [Bacteroidales bacterium]